MSEIRLQDGLDTMKDSINDKKPKSMYHTEVECTNEFGEVLFKKSNIILLGGRRFTLEKLFNITPKDTGRLTLNKILADLKGQSAIAEESYDQEFTSKHGAGPRKEQCVCLFGVGNGGSAMEFGSLANPVAKESNLYNILPMRYVEEEHKDDVEETRKYYMHFVNTLADGSKRHAYYLKKFEETPTIKLVVDNGVEYSPVNADNNPNYGNSTNSYVLTDDVDAYIEIKLKISSDDIREYFDETEGIESSRINELALYFGYPASDDTDVWVDYIGVEAFSKLTFNNEPLTEESKELNIVYRIYI